ncbi:hypothetical protein BGX20_011583, partial [Mortierella sp. AD010]
MCSVFSQQFKSSLQVKKRCSLLDRMDSNIHHIRILQLLELRVIKSVCKYVTIILKAISEIQVFFFIFIGGITAFAVALMHLFHGCAVSGCIKAIEINNSTSTVFPGRFMGALATTTYFVGGVYDTVSADLDGASWPIHVMMIMYLFFTVVLMMNVLIALINVAFNKGDSNWEQVWLENRLRHVESAENMTYHIPGFRKAHNWFPREIYYSATPEDVKAYREKYEPFVPEQSAQDLKKSIEAAKREILESLKNSAQADGEASDEGTESTSKPTESHSMDEEGDMDE